MTETHDFTRAIIFRHSVAGFIKPPGSHKTGDAQSISFYSFDLIPILSLCPDGFERMGDDTGLVKTPT